MGQQTRVGTVATKVIREDDGRIRVRYHATDVVAWDPATRTVRLDSGGWRTVTTKTRMIQASNQFGFGFHVFQHDHDWYVETPDGRIWEFRDGFTIDLEGDDPYVLTRNGATGAVPAKVGQ